MTNYAKVCDLVDSASEEAQVRFFNFMLGYFGASFTDDFTKRAELYLQPQETKETN